MFLNNKELEITAIAISMSAGCIPCTHFHLRQADREGASSLERLQSMYLAVAGGAKANLPQIALGEFTRQLNSTTSATVDAADAVVAVGLPRLARLATIGISVARNDVAQLKADIKSAREMAISDDEIMEVISLGNRIKEKAASHLVPVSDQLDAAPGTAATADSICT